MPGLIALHVTDSDHRTRARAVFVCQRSFQHVSEDFHIAVRVSWKAGAGNHPIFIDYSKITEAHLLRVMVVAKRKGVTAVEPA